MLYLFEIFSARRTKKNTKPEQLQVIDQHELCIIPCPCVTVSVGEKGGPSGRSRTSWEDGHASSVSAFSLPASSGLRPSSFLHTHNCDNTVGVGAHLWDPASIFCELVLPEEAVDLVFTGLMVILCILPRGFSEPASILYIELQPEKAVEPRHHDLSLSDSSLKASL